MGKKDHKSYEDVMKMLKSVPGVKDYLSSKEVVAEKERLKRKYGKGDKNA